ncbi:methionyl-tRNA formyltransferase [Buchnera aphidicola]|uniref:methionyl-tRNA formyltransferase n=1 Tax=Buchnera aphidicola TaxID=9 RepID=UPI0030EF63DB
MKKIKIIFAGNDAFSLKHLKKIFLLSFVKLKAIIISKKKKRNQKISYIEKFSKKNNIKLIKVKNFNSKIKKKLKNINSDLLLVVSFGMIIPKKILKIFTLGGINIHASLLPKWRGCSPIQNSILSGDKKTGISIIQMNTEIDSGDIIYIKEYKIKKKENYNSLSNNLAKIGKQSIVKVLNQILKQKIKKIPQNNNKATYTKKIKKKDGHINWNNSAKKIERMIRAYKPWPSSYFFINKKMVKILKSEIILKKKKNKNKNLIGKIKDFNKNGILIETKKNFLNITKLQISGKKKNYSCNLYNSYKNFFKIGKLLT